MGAKYATSKKVNRDVHANTLSSIGLEDSPHGKDKPPRPSKRSKKAFKEDSVELEPSPKEIQMQVLLDLLNDSKESEVTMPAALQESESIQKLLTIME